jgi:sugar phosphate isomerase/epimerase
MTFHPFYYGSHQTQEERIKSNIIVLKEMVAYCQEIGIKAMIENYIAPFDRPETISKILDQVPNLYVHLDIGHCNLGDEPEKTVEIFFKTFKEKVLHLHVHDNNGDEDEHLPLGCGEIDWGKMIGIAKKFKYDSTITLEVFCTDKDFLLISKKKILKFWGQR